MNKSNTRPEVIETPVNKNYAHDLSHRHTTTLDFFRLQPVLCQEIVPGDKMSVDLRAIIQSAPLASQVFGGCHLDLHAFFVPNRIVFSDWDNYILGNNRSVGNAYSLPSVSANEIYEACNPAYVVGDARQERKEVARVFSSLGYPCYLNIGSISAQSYRYSAIQARAYQKIWWDYYRDSVNIPESNKSSYLSTSGGSVSAPSLFQARYRTFKKDFVSTLLASPQLGDASTVDGEFRKGEILNTIGPNSGVLYFEGNYPSASGLFLGSSGVAAEQSRQSIVPSINAQALRGVMAMQRYLERLNVTGTRPMERILALLGVKPSAERLDNAEFLGGKTIRVDINGLVNSGSNEQVTTLDEDGLRNAWGVSNSAGDYGDHFGQGYQSGYAHGSGQSEKINYTATEYGTLMVIASLIPEYSNPNAVQRQFIRGLSTPEADRYDFFTPDFDGLGYQEMLLSEVCTPSSVDAMYNAPASWSTNYNPYNVVGYQPKYEDYRYCADRLSGDFLDSDSAIALRNLVFTVAYPEVLTVPQVQAGLRLTTSNFGYRALFDRHFQISSPSLDHFVLHLSIVNDASRPIANAQLPTELSDLANSTLLDVSNGGVRL